MENPKQIEGKKQSLTTIKGLRSKTIIELLAAFFILFFASCNNDKQQEQINNNTLAIELYNNSGKINISQPLTIEINDTSFFINNEVIASRTGKIHLYQSQIFISNSSINNSIKESEDINIENLDKYINKNQGLVDGIPNGSKLILMKDKEGKRYITVITKYGDIKKIPVGGGLSLRIEGYFPNGDVMHISRKNIGDLIEITSWTESPQNYNNNSIQQNENGDEIIPNKTDNLGISGLTGAIETMKYYGNITPEQYKQRISSIQLIILGENNKEPINSIIKTSTIQHKYSELQERCKNNPNTIFFVANSMGKYLNKEGFINLIECSKLNNVVLFLTLSDIEQISDYDKGLLNHLNKNHTFITLPNNTFKQSPESYENLPEGLLNGEFGTLIFGGNSSEELAKFMALSTILTKINKNNPLEEITNAADNEDLRITLNGKNVDINVKKINLDNYLDNHYKEAFRPKNLPFEINPGESILLEKPYEPSYFSGPGIIIDLDESWIPYNDAKDLIDHESLPSHEYKIDYNLCEKVGYGLNNIPVYYHLIKDNKEHVIKYVIRINKSNQ